MGNMSYCRFQNTLLALRDCYESLWDDDLSDEEGQARDSLVKLCKTIAEEVDV
jgi:hypothetical protein